jgi:RNA polymerase sigma-70 factor, ECF subfamily
LSIASNNDFRISTLESDPVFRTAVIPGESPGEKTARREPRSALNSALDNMTAITDNEGESISEELIQQWVAEVKAGEMESYRKIVDHFALPLQTIILRMVLSWEEAKDLAQDTFVQAFRSLHTYEPRGKFQSWLYRIGTRKALDYLRSEARQKEIVQKMSETCRLEYGDAPHPFHVEHNELARKIESAIAELKDEQRLAFILFEYEHHSYQEIAETLSTSVKSVEMHIYRARAALKDKLRKYLLE